jgi:hypothetical protein
MSKAKKELLSKLIRDLNSEVECFEFGNKGCWEWLKHKVSGQCLDCGFLDSGWLYVKYNNDESGRYRIELSFLEEWRLARAFNNWKAKHLLNTLTLSKSSGF